jgi:hypothetical protein
MEELDQVCGRVGAILASATCPSSACAERIDGSSGRYGQTVEMDDNQHLHRPSDSDSPTESEQNVPDAPTRDADGVAAVISRGPRLTREIVETLYAQGMSDREIAAATGSSLPIAIIVRVALDLPPHPRSAYDAGRDRRELLRAMLAAGCDDAGIARALRVLPAMVAHLRGEWELAPNPPPPRDDATACWRHYRRGLSDEQIAMETGLKPAQVARWRERYALPPVPAA